MQPHFEAHTVALFDLYRMRYLQRRFAHLAYPFHISYRKNTTLPDYKQPFSFPEKFPQIINRGFLILENSIGL